MWSNPDPAKMTQNTLQQRNCFITLGNTTIAKNPFSVDFSATKPSLGAPGGAVGRLAWLVSSGGGGHYGGSLTFTGNICQNLGQNLESPKTAFFSRWVDCQSISDARNHFLEFACFLLRFCNFTFAWLEENVAFFKIKKKGFKIKWYFRVFWPKNLRYLKK